MAKLLMNLRHVPGEEADGVRAFLDAADIDWYETRPGLFGISAGGIWLRHDADFARARRSMDEYQAQRSAKVRAEHRQALRDGTAETFMDMLRARPVWVLWRVAAIILLLALMGLPAYLLWR